MAAEKHEEVETMPSQQQLRVVLAMTTLLLCCLATAPCGYVLLNFKKFQFRPKTLFCTGVVVALDMVHCWLLLFFNIPSQLKGLWLFGHPACVMQAFITRVLKGGSHLALIILALQGCCCGGWLIGCSKVMRYTKLLYFFIWGIVGSVSIFPFVSDGAEYNFNVNLSYCDVSRKYFVMHDIITYCVPVVFLFALSVRLNMCMCHQTTASITSSPCSSHCSNSESLEDSPTDDDVTQSMVAGMTSDKDMSSPASRATGRPPLDLKSTMTICFLCTETMLLTLTEWSLRLSGVLLPSSSLLACSVLFACAGYIVRSTTIIIVERTYRGSPIFTALTSSANLDDNTQSRANQRHQKHKHSFSDLDRNRTKRQRYERQPARPCVGPRFSFAGRWMDPRRSLDTSTMDCQMTVASGITALSSELSSSNSSVLTSLTSLSKDRALCAASQLNLDSAASASGQSGVSHGVRKRLSRQTTSSTLSFYSHFLSENLCRELLMPRNGRVNCSRPTGTATTTTTHKRKLSPRTFFDRLPRSRRRSIERRPSFGQDITLRMTDQKQSAHNSVSERMAFFRRPLQNLGISRPREGDGGGLFRAERQGLPFSSRASIFANFGAGTQSRREHASTRRDDGSTLRRKSHPIRDSDRRFKAADERDTRSKTEDGKEIEREQKYFAFHPWSPPSPTSPSSCLHTVATEDSQWDGSPDTLSPVWLNSPCLKSGRIHRQDSKSHSNTSEPPPFLVESVR